MTSHDNQIQRIAWIQTFRYIDKKGNLLRTRTELTVAQTLDFFGPDDYQYDHKVDTKKWQHEVKIDFKTDKGPHRGNRRGIRH